MVDEQRSQMSEGYLEKALICVEFELSLIGHRQQLGVYPWLYSLTRLAMLLFSMPINILYMADCQTKYAPLPKGKLPLIFFGNNLREFEVVRIESESLFERLNKERLDGEGGGLGCDCGNGGTGGG